MQITSSLFGPIMAVQSVNTDATIHLSGLLLNHLTVHEDGSGYVSICSFFRDDGGLSTSSL